MPAPKDPPRNDLVKEAEAKAGNYEWSTAAQLYRRALDITETSENGRIAELLAKSLYKASRQSNTREEFDSRMAEAKEAYENASQHYSKTGQQGHSTRMLSRARFAEFWLADDSNTKRNIITESVRLAEEAAKSFEAEGDTEGQAMSHRDLLDLLPEVQNFSIDYLTKRETFMKFMAIARKAIAEFEQHGQHLAFAESLGIATQGLANAADIAATPAEYREFSAELSRLHERLVQTVSTTTSPYIQYVLKDSLAGKAAYDGDERKAAETYESAMVDARKTGDSLFIGRLLTGLANSMLSLTFYTEDSEEKRKLLEKGASLCAEAETVLKVIHHQGSLEDIYYIYPEFYTYLATDVETDAAEKKACARKAVEIGMNGIKYKSKAFTTVDHSLSKALYFLASLEESEEKLELLRRAREVREQSMSGIDILYPHSWAPGGARNYLAIIKAEQAKLAQDPEKKIDLLQSAISDMEKAVEICSKWANTPGSENVLGRYEEWYGDILLQLNTLTGQAAPAQRSISIYKDSMLNYGKSGTSGSLPTLWWKLARAHDLLGEYKESAAAFRNASEAYVLNAGRIPALASTFRELGSYMEAWSAIEEAREHHQSGQFQSAAEAYAKAAALFEKTKTWASLAKHYAACSLLEGGEALCRQEKADEAAESFQSSQKMFTEARAELEERLRQTATPQDKRETETVLKLTETRRKYVQGRRDMEQATVLDRDGDEEASSGKFHSASEAFRELLPEAAGQSRSELESLSQFCASWAKMKKAEAEASPNLYSEAADSFIKAKDTAKTKRERFIALANASICRALEAGTRFRLTQDTGLYSEIKKSLEAAAGYYEEAGMATRAEWTRATQRMFDALAYLSDAEAEKDPKKKAELYHLGEKHMQLAAKLYGAAGFQKKQQEANRNLKRAREEKELLLTPIDALAENPATSSGAVSPASLVRDQPLGLDRFESANVVGQLNLPKTEAGVGSELTLELEIANVGKTVATLMRLENVAPDGLEITGHDPAYRVEDNYIDMKGKRLDYLKTHGLRVPVKAVRKGTFQLRPRILFLDERGAHRSYDFEPASVTVKELGISGWLKGPSK